MFVRFCSVLRAAEVGGGGGLGVVYARSRMTEAHMPWNVVPWCPVDRDVELRHHHVDNI